MSSTVTARPKTSLATEMVIKRQAAPDTPEIPYRFGGGLEALT
jgi:hypothetical protein